MNCAGIIFSGLNNSNHSRLTADRTVAAIPFAARYRLLDFPLSNMVNAGISDISIVANYNYRSLITHIGSGKDWDLAGRRRGVNFVSPFQYARSRGEKVMFSTHLEALCSMREYIDEIKEDYVAVMDSDVVCNIDIREVITELERRRGSIMIVTRSVGEDFNSKTTRMMLQSTDGVIKDVSLSDTYSPKCPELSLGIIVFKTYTLRKILDEATAHGLSSLTDLIMRQYREIGAFSYCFNGYAALISGFSDYYKCSMELVACETAFASLFADKDFPILTRTYNSAPAFYKSGAHACGSLIADDCYIEGEVVNSILFRGVHVERGASVRDCVLFSGTRVASGASLKSIVTDKNVFVSEKTELYGSFGMPFYIEKGRRV